MKKILNIATSLNGEASFSNQLSNEIISKLTVEYPGIEVKTRDLTKKPLPHLEGMHFGAFFTPEENRSPEQLEAVRLSDEAVKELMEADILIIGVPLYNFGIPSTLKSWIDHIIRVGITFSYTGGVIEGNVKDKKVYLAIATGGIYSEGPMKDHDFTENYLRIALGFIGMTDITVFRIEGTYSPEHKETAVTKAWDLVNEYGF